MRRVMTLAAAALMMCGVQKAAAQESENKGTWGGLRVSYGTRIENPGIGAVLQTWLCDWARAEVGCDYFFKKTNRTNLGNTGTGALIWATEYSLYDLTADVHIVVPLAGKVHPYAVAGTTVAVWDVNSSMDTHIGPNLGVGFDLMVRSKTRLNIEWHHQLVKDYDQSVFSIGAVFGI